MTDDHTTPEHDGHDAEFVALLTGHQQVLRLYIASLMPGCQEVEDIAQLANSTIWKKRAEFEIGTNFKAWVFAIARFEVLGFRKREARNARLVFSDELEEIFAEELPALPDDMADRQAALQACLAQLKPGQRKLIEHRYFHRTPLKEYADEVGRSASGLKVTLHRIRTALARCIEHKLTVAS